MTGIEKQLKALVDEYKAKLVEVQGEDDKKAQIIKDLQAIDKETQDYFAESRAEISNPLYDFYCKKEMDKGMLLEEEINGRETYELLKNNSHVDISIAGHEYILDKGASEGLRSWLLPYYEKMFGVKLDAPLPERI